MNTNSHDSCSIPHRIDGVITAATELIDQLHALAEGRRALALTDPDSPWHALADAAVADLHTRLHKISFSMAPVGTRAVALAAGVPTATVRAACAAGEIEATRADSGEILIETDAARKWLASR